jgi:Flp pilus assembly protein TadB
VADRDEVVLVTTAARSPRDERRDRERRYLITMGIRVVAFVVAIVVARGWVRVVAVALALVLPWIAVVAANAPHRSRREAPALYRRRAPHEITEHSTKQDADHSMSA